MKYTEVIGLHDKHNIIIYSLSTCPHCTAAKEYLKKRGYAFRYIDVDEASRDEKREVTIFLRKNNLSIAFPVTIIDKKIIQEFEEQAMEKLLRARIQ